MLYSPSSFPPSSGLVELGDKGGFVPVPTYPLIPFFNLYWFGNYTLDIYFLNVILEILTCILTKVLINIFIFFPDSSKTLEYLNPG